MKLERLVGILMILLHERNITAKVLAHRFGVSKIGICGSLENTWF